VILEIEVLGAVDCVVDIPGFDVAIGATVEVLDLLIMLLVD